MAYIRRRKGSWQADAAENILEKIDNDRNKIDPDTFKGLGAYQENYN